MRKAEWIKIDADNLEMPNKDSYCRIAFRATCKTFNYDTMAEESSWLSGIGIGEISAYFDSYGKWVIIIGQLDTMYEDYLGCDIVFNFTNEYGDIEFYTGENIAVKQVVRQETKKRKYIDQLEVEVLAWYPMPDDYEETEMSHEEV